MDYLKVSQLDFEVYLVENYSILYSELPIPGFLSGVGPGWYKIIDELSKKIEPLAQLELIRNPHSQPPKVVQVKEKFGTLRYYVSFSDYEIDTAIDAAELETNFTCYECGRFSNKKSKLNNWLINLCNDCKFLKGIE